MWRDLGHVVRGGRALVRSLTSPDPVEVGFAAFSAAARVARRGASAHYVARIASTVAVPRSVRLLIDVYALRAPANSDGHHAYFWRSLRIAPRASTTVEIAYDWARTAHFSWGGRSFAPEDFWRGGEGLPQIYIVYALVLDPERGEIDRSMVAQDLQA
jgi:hypothetical protein